MTESDAAVARMAEAAGVGPHPNPPPHAAEGATNTDAVTAMMEMLTQSKGKGG